MQRNIFKKNKDKRNSEDVVDKAYFEGDSRSLKRAGKEEENKGGTTNCSESSWFDVLSAKSNALVSTVSHSQNKYTGRTPVWSWSPGSKS